MKTRKPRNVWHALARVLLLTVAILCQSAAFADDMVLQVWKSDGQVININLNEEPKTTYSDGNLVITTTKTTVTYPLESVRRYTYASASTGIETPKSVSSVLSSDGETLTFTNLKAGTSIKLYNVAGQLLRTITSGAESSTTVSVSQLPTGVYVVKVNDATYKITKR